MLLARIMKWSGCIVIAVASACLGQQAVRQEPTKPAAKPSPPANVLVFCDRTPGALFWADTWQGVADQTGDRLTLTTSVEDFTTQLTAGPWSRVMVLARWAPGEPAYGSALRQYAEAHPKQRMEMFLWHDHGTQPDPKTAVLASTALVTWQVRTTVIGYSLVSSDVPKAAETKIMPGLVLPDFQNLRTEPPMVVGLVSEGPEGRVIIMAMTADPCADRCKKTYMSALTRCTEDNGDDIGTCEVLYGPDAENPDPEKYNECLTEATKNFSSCRTAAGDRYKRCLELCKIHPAPAPAPVPRPGLEQGPEGIEP